MEDQSGLSDDRAYRNICDRRQILLNALKVMNSEVFDKSCRGLSSCPTNYGNGLCGGKKVHSGATTSLVELRTELNLGVC